MHCCVHVDYLYTYTCHVATLISEYDGLFSEYGFTIHAVIETLTSKTNKTLTYAHNHIHTYVYTHMYASIHSHM